MSMLIGSCPALVIAERGAGEAEHGLRSQSKIWVTQSDSSHYSEPIGAHKGPVRHLNQQDHSGYLPRHLSPAMLLGIFKNAGYATDRKPV
jgi:hypothetical protein